MSLFGLFGVNVEKLKAKGDVEGLFQLAIDNKSNASRKACQALEELGDQVVTPLIACVKQYYEVNKKLSCGDIAATLVRVGPAIVMPLTRLLEQSKSDISAIIALGKLKDPRSVQVLYGALKLGNPLITVQAAVALAAIGNEEAVAALIQALDAADFIIRADAAYALGGIGDQSLIPVLTKACSDPHERVQAEAKKALDQIKMRQR